MIGPNGAGKRPCSDDHRQGEAGQRHDPDRRNGQAGYVDQRPIALIPTRPSMRSSPMAIRCWAGKGQCARLLRPLQLRRDRSAEKSQGSVGRRTQSRPSGPDAEGGPTSSSSTSRRTISTSTPSGALEEGWKALPVAPSSAATTAGSSTVSPRISWPSKAIAKWSGTKATTANTKPIGSAGSAKKLISRTGYGIAS